MKRLYDSTSIHHSEGENNSQKGIFRKASQFERSIKGLIQKKMRLPYAVHSFHDAFQVDRKCRVKP